MKKSGEIPTMFPKGTVVKFNSIPCELLQDTPYYSETFKGRQKNASHQGNPADTESTMTESVQQPEIKFCEVCGTPIGCR